MTITPPPFVTIAGHRIELGGSQNLAASDLTNGTTGTGDIALATSPMLTTPDIGAATGTSLSVTNDLIANSSGNTYIPSVDLAGHFMAIATDATVEKSAGRATMYLMAPPGDVAGSGPISAFDVELFLASNPPTGDSGTWAAGTVLVLNAECGTQTGTQGAGDTLVSLGMINTSLHLTGTHIETLWGFGVLDGPFGNPETTVVDTEYGFYIPASTLVGTTKYCLYFGDSSPSYMAGGLQLGGTSGTLPTLAVGPVQALIHGDLAVATGPDGNSNIWFLNGANSAVGGIECGSSGMFYSSIAGQPLYFRPNGSVALTLASDLSATFGAGITINSTTLISTTTSFANGSGGGSGTLANAPSSGNPTKWIPVDDNGTTRYVPAW